MYKLVFLGTLIIVLSILVCVGAVVAIIWFLYRNRKSDLSNTIKSYGEYIETSEILKKEK